MVLTPTQAHSLELAIQSALSRIPILNEDIHQRNFMKMFGIVDPDEYVYGYSMGFIANAFFNSIFLTEGRVPTEDEKLEAETIVLQRSVEIRNAISLRRYQIKR